jgi:hypothetical protein
MDTGEGGGGQRLDVPVDDSAPSGEPAGKNRKRPVRKLTILIDRFPKEKLERGRRLYPERIESRPRTRGECVDGPRPCPYVGCRWHLYLDESLGNITLNFPDLEPHELAESCSLDVAERGGATRQNVGEMLNLTGEGVRNIEKTAMGKPRVAALVKGFR